MSHAAALSPPSASTFSGGAALEHGFGRILQAPGRAVWLFGWDGVTALVLILIGAHFVMTAEMGQPRGIAGTFFLSAVFARHLASEAAWLRFFLGEPQAKPYAPFRLGSDEWRLLLAGWIASFVMILFGAVTLIPLMIVTSVLQHSHTALAWALLLAGAAGLFLVLFPRLLITLASTVYLKRVAPFDDMAASGRIWGRAAAVGAMIIATLLLAFTVFGLLFQIAGLAEDYQSFGAHFDVIHKWALTAPLSATDGLVLACAMLGASLFWVMARGAAAYAALVLAQAQAEGATPPASSAGPYPAPEAV